MLSENRIGFYIHWHAHNYKKYGIGYKNKGIPAKSAFKQTKNKIKTSAKRSKVSDSELQKLSRFLTKLYFGTKKQKDNSMYDHFFKLWDAEFQKINNKLSSVGVSKEGNIYVKPKGKTPYDKSSTLNLNQLNNLAKKMKKYTDIYNNDANLMKDFNNFQNTLAKLSQQAKNYNDSIKLSNDDLYEQLNHLVSVFAFPYKTIYGQLGETFLAAASAVLNKNVDATLKQVEKALVSDARSSTIVKREDFSKFVDFNKVVNLSGDKKNGIDYVIGSSQNKTDITFTFHNTPLDVSVKYVGKGKSSNSSGILSGASLLSLLSNEYHNTINHWLNLTSEHVNYSGKAKMSLTGYQAEKQMAINTMKLLILSRALSGDLTGRTGAANTIAFINTRNRKVRIMNISTIMNKAINRIDTILDLKDDVLDDFKIPNDFGKAQYSKITSRITYILNQVHQRKIKASLLRTYIDEETSKIKVK